jgi:hypothetical protein
MMMSRRQRRQQRRTRRMGITIHRIQTAGQKSWHKAINHNNDKNEQGSTITVITKQQQ